jgi:hypothetical protein
VELPRHDVLFAEDLPVESYLDIGDRSNFSGSMPVGLFPDFSTSTEFGGDMGNRGMRPAGGAWT